jgi:uncharacterized protein YbaR (Trm112 family)
MTLDLLVCPGCRTLANGRLDVRTLDRIGDVLACACGRRYPIVDDVPILMKELGPYLQTELTGVLERDLDSEVAALLVEDGPDDAPYPRMLEQLSVYLDAHWGDLANPRPEPGFALAPFVERVAARPGVATAIELGCNVGRMLAHIPAERVIGVDMSFAALRRAQRLLDGEALEYPRRLVGRNYAAATITPPRPSPSARHALVCSDILDPPVLPGMFDRVVAFNVLDSVRHPRQLLMVLDGLCAPGGELLLASPYQWQSAVMEEHERFGGADPAGALVDFLVTGEGLRIPYVIEDQAEIMWTLRRDARSSVTYRTHYVRARKGT